MEITEFQRGHSFTAGGTGSGKTLATVRSVIAAAMMGMAVVILDPHRRSLAWNSLLHLVASGHERRIIFDALPNLQATPGYRILPPSAARDPRRRDSENDQTARNFAQLLAWRRDLGSLAIQPQTEEWVMGAARLATYRDPDDEISAGLLPFAFVPGHKNFTYLLDGCRHEATVREFRQLGRKVSRNEILSARRLVTNVCTQPAFALRCGTSLDLPRFLAKRGILIVEGGTHGVSDEAIRVMLGSVRHQVIRYVFDRSRPFPEIALFIDEAINWGLIDSTLLKAAAETRKMGLHIHLIAQAPSLPGDDLHNLLTNTSRHNWHCLPDDTYARRAAADLGNPELRGPIMRLRPGQRYVKFRGEVFEEQLPLLEEPWVFPGLSDLKAKRALTRIRRRPEFQGTPACPRSHRATTRSSNSANTAFASNANSGGSFPAGESAAVVSPPFERVDGCGPLDD